MKKIDYRKAWLHIRSIFWLVVGGLILGSTFLGLLLVVAMGVGIATFNVLFTDVTKSILSNVDSCIAFTLFFSTLLGIVISPSDRPLMDEDLSKIKKLIWRLTPVGLIFFIYKHDKCAHR